MKEERGLYSTIVYIKINHKGGYIYINDNLEIKMPFETIDC
jgi:hypothetical protein